MVMMALNMALNVSNQRAGKKKITPVNNLTLPSLSGDTIGMPTIVSFGVWENTDTLTGEVLKNGSVVHSGIADGQVIDWTSADDEASVVLRVTALGVDGDALVETSAPVYLRVAPPAVIGSMFDEIFDEGTGDQQIDVSTVFSGDNLTYSVIGTGVTIDPATGVLTISTETPLSSADVVVAASNSGGTVQTAFLLTIEAIVEVVMPSGSPIKLYDSSFALDRTVDFNTSGLGGATLTHDATVSASQDPINGAMLLGSKVSTIPWVAVDVDVSAGNVLQVYGLFARTGSFINWIRYQWLNSSGAVVGEGSETTNVGVLQWITEPAPASAAKLRFRMAADTGAGEYLQIRRVMIYDITASGPLPDRLKSAVSKVSPYFYVGETTTVSLEGLFDDTVDTFVYAGGEPHSIDNVAKTLTITPTATTSGYVTQSIFGFSGGVPAITPVDLTVNVQDSPATLSATTQDEQYIEIGRPMIPIAPERACTGGVKPFSYSVISLPVWAEWIPESQQVVGFPDAANGPEMVTIRVTDQRGDTADVTATINSIAVRSRTPTITITTNNTVVTDTDVSDGDVVHFATGVTGCSISFSRMKDPSNPVIFTTAPGVVLDSVSIEGVYSTYKAGGVVLDGLTIEQTTGGKCLNLKDAQHVHVYDCTLTGLTSTDAANLYKSVPPYPAYSYMSIGVYIRGDNTRVAIDGLTMEKVHYGFSIYDVASAASGDTGSGMAITNTLQSLTAADNMQNIGGSNLWVENWTSEGHDGNVKDASHPDGIQLSDDIGSGQPLQHLAFRNVLVAGGRSYASDVQGLFGRGEKWDATGHSGENTNRNILFENFFMTCAHASHAFALEDYTDITVKNAFFLGHPDWTANSAIRTRGESEITFEDCAAFQVQHDNDTQDFTTFTNFVNLSGTALIDIFPNWNDTSGAYSHDPRVDGKYARFWIDPAGDWAIAHPKTGPGWLRQS